MSDLSHLAEDYRERAMWADKERIAWIRMDRWLGFPKAETVRKTLDAMLRYPPRTRMPCLLIYGQTGMGKSRIVERFEAENPRGFNDTTGTAMIPVVAVQLPPQPTDGEFYGEVLEKLGAGFAGRGDVQRARQLTRRLMGQVGARMLILDEINHMLACTPRQQRVFLNTLRYLANDLQIPLVCTGNHEARAALLTDAALAERFDAVELVVATRISRDDFVEAGTRERQRAGDLWHHDGRVAADRRSRHRRAPRRFQPRARPASCRPVFPG